MIHKLRGFAKDSFLYGLGDSLSRLTSIILVPILSRIFVPADYGIIDLLSLSYYFLFMAIGLNVLTGLQKFYYLKNGKKRQTLVTSVIFGLFLFVSFIAVIIVIFAQNISALSFSTGNYSILIVLLGCCLPIETLFSSLVLLLRLNRKAIMFTVYNIISLILNTLITYACVVWLRAGIAGVFIAKLTSFCIIVVVMLFQQRHEFTRKVDLRIFKDVLLYSIPGHPAILIKSIMDFLPTYILAYFSTLTIVGLYGMAHRIARFITLYEISFNRAWNPFAFSNAGKPDEKSLYEKIFKMYAASLIFLGMTLTLFAKEILHILTPPKYHSAFVLVGGICLYLGLLGLRMIFSTALYSVNKVKFTSYMSLINFATFSVCAVILVPLYDVQGLIASLDIAAAIYVICYLITIKTHFKFSLSFYRLSLVLGLASSGVYIFYHLDTPIILAVTNKLCFTVIYVIINYYILFSEKEKTVIRESIFSITSQCFALLGQSWKRLLYYFRPLRGKEI